jgi:hypothetical protein
VANLSSEQFIANYIIKQHFKRASEDELSSYLKSQIFLQDVHPIIKSLIDNVLRSWDLQEKDRFQPASLQSFESRNKNPLTTNSINKLEASGSFLNKVTQSGLNKSLNTNKITTHLQSKREDSTMCPDINPTASDANAVASSSESTSPSTLVTKTFQPQNLTSTDAKNTSAILQEPSLPTWSQQVSFLLPNANVGQQYNTLIKPITPVSGLEVVQLKVAEDFGLHFDKELNSLTGVPNKDGIFDIEISFCVQGYKGTMTSKLRIIINPDPKSLWKNIASDPIGIYAKPDDDSGFINGSDGFTLIAGSKRGRSHAQKGTYRDDDFFIFSRDDGWQIAIVSDGAGSAKYSRRGSQIICNHGGQFLNATLEQGAASAMDRAVEDWFNSSSGIGSFISDESRILKNTLFTTLGYTAFEAMKSIHKEIETKSDLGAVVKDYSSTALLSLVKRFPFGVFCSAFSVGDGLIGVYRVDGTPLLLSEADGGEFSGQTRFLSNDTVSAEELSKRLRFDLIPNSSFKGLHLMTDGVSDPFFQTDKGMGMPERWAVLISEIEAGAALSTRTPDSALRLVNWLDFWSKGEHDDRTLAIIY